MPEAHDAAILTLIRILGLCCKRGEGQRRLWDSIPSGLFTGMPERRCHNQWATRHRPGCS